MSLITQYDNEKTVWDESNEKTVIIRKLEVKLGKSKVFEDCIRFLAEKEFGFQSGGKATINGCLIEGIARLKKIELLAWACPKCGNNNPDLFSTERYSSLGKAFEYKCLNSSCNWKSGTCYTEEKLLEALRVERIQNLPDSVLDCHKIIKRLETENFGQSDLITNLETENAKLKELLDECFEKVIGALGAGYSFEPSREYEDLANRVHKVLQNKHKPIWTQAEFDALAKEIKDKEITLSKNAPEAK